LNIKLFTQLNVAFGKKVIQEETDNQEHSSPSNSKV